MSFAENCKTTVHDFYQPLTGMRRRTEDFGLEIEMEGDNLPPGGLPCPGWDIHMDNSLRGPKGLGQGGAEYTTRGAVSLVDVVPLVTRLQDTMRKGKVNLRDDSPRTSTHIHINVQGMSFIDVFGFITVFAAVEPLFLHLCGPRRNGNSFCASSFDSGDLPDWFHEAFRAIENMRPGEYHEMPGRGKYASLGTFRLHDLGTLEARCFPFSLDPETIMTWCLWLINIRDMVQKQEDKSFRSLIKLGLHDPMVLVQTIFGHLDMQVSPYLASELIQYGSREAYELTRLMKFFLNKKPDEKKKKTKGPVPDDFTIIDDMIADAQPRVQLNLNPRPVRWGAAAIAHPQGAHPAPRRRGE